MSQTLATKLSRRRLLKRSNSRQLRFFLKSIYQWNGIVQSSRRTSLLFLKTLHVNTFVDQSLSLTLKNDAIQIGTLLRITLQMKGQESKCCIFTEYFIKSKDFTGYQVGIKHQPPPHPKPDGYGPGSQCNLCNVESQICSRLKIQITQVNGEITRIPAVQINNIIQCFSN